MEAKKRQALKKTLMDLDTLGVRLFVFSIEIWKFIDRQTAILDSLVAGDSKTKKKK